MVRGIQCRLIVVHAGGVEGWVEGADLVLGPRQTVQTIMTK